jgi:hypothetical protein
MKSWLETGNSKTHEKAGYMIGRKKMKLQTLQVFNF